MSWEQDKKKISHVPSVLPYIFLLKKYIKLIKQKHAKSKSALFLPYKNNSFFTFKSSEVILAECIYFA